MLEVFHADQLSAIQGRDKGQAAVDRAIAQPVTVGLGQHHGAGATVARGAAFLGAGLAAALAQVLQHGKVGIEPLFNAQLLVQQKPDHGRSPPGLECLDGG